MRRIPVHRLLVTFFEDFFSFDTKLWNTLRASFSRPGRITIDYLAGKRARYVPPLKFYIFVSFVFFLLVGRLSNDAIDSSKSSKWGEDDLGSMSVSIGDLQGRGGGHHPNDTSKIQQVELEFRPGDSLRRQLALLQNAPDSVIDKLLVVENIDTTDDNRQRLRNALALIPANCNLLDSLKPSYNIYNIKFNTREEYQQFRKSISGYSNAQLDSILTARGESPGWFNRQMVRKLAKFDRNDKDDVKQIIQAIIKSISLTMFIMMPLTAILLLLIFYRKKYYYEHLIFSIHIHTIFFIIFSMVMAIQIFVSERVGQKMLGWSFLICLIYLIVSLRNNYGQSWGKTIFKFILMSIPYLVVATTLTILAVIYGFLA